MPSVSTKQRYRSKLIMLKSENANETDEIKQHSQVAEQMNRPDWNALLSGGLSWNRLHTQPAVYENEFGRDRWFDREGWRPDIPWGGYEQPGRQNDSYRTTNQRQFYNQSKFQGGQVYGHGPSGRPSSWVQQPAASYSEANFSHAYYPEIHSAASAWLGTFEQPNYSQIQRYAPLPLQYQPHHQTVPFGNITQSWLTQPWQAVNEVLRPPSRPPSVNFSGRIFDGSAPPFTSPNSQIPDIDKGLDEVFRTDKRIKNIYDEPSQGFQKRKSYDGGVPLPPPRNQIHGAGWQQVVDIRGSATNTRDDATKAVMTTQKLRPQQPWHHVQPALDPSPRNKWSRSPTTKQQKLHVMERPVPSQKYVEQANQEPRTLDASRSLLVVLDLNGTLLHRKTIGSTNFIARPRVKEFLHYLFQQHHVLIWSSAMPSNVKRMSNKILTGDQKELLIACWGRDKLRIPSHAYHENVQVYKQLSWIWKDKQIQSSNPTPAEIWGQENTVLIDDSFVKAASEPHNVILLEDFEGKTDQMESDVLGQVVNYLETLKWQRDVSAYMRCEPFEFDASGATFDWMPIVNGMYGFALI